MLFRSIRQQARENADLVAQLAPALAATALLSYFQYRALKKRFLLGAHVKRIDDLEAHTPILAVSTLGIVLALWGLFAFAAWTFRGHAAFIPVAALSAYTVWLLIKRLLAAQAACLLGVVPRQDLKAITLPVLVYHHAKDACKHCQASEAPFIIKGLTNAPIKKLMVVDGGANPTGDECAGQHWHGFIGMEHEAVDQIARWIKSPAN